MPLQCGHDRIPTGCRVRTGEKGGRRQRGDIHVQKRTGRDNTRKTALPRCYYEKINFQPVRFPTFEKYCDVSHFLLRSQLSHDSAYETAGHSFCDSVRANRTFVVILFSSTFLEVLKVIYINCLGIKHVYIHSEKIIRLTKT